jgi:hypothetical protein
MKMRIAETVQRYPIRAGGIIVGFLVFTVPIGIFTAWPTFVKDKTIPQWLAERGWPEPFILFVLWVICSFGLALIVVILLSITSQTKSQDASQTVAASKTASSE